MTAKLSDKRQFQTKSLQNEIHIKLEEQKHDPDFTGQPAPVFQLVYSFDDEDVLHDATRLFLFFAERNFPNEMHRLLPFVKDFIPLFFGIPLEGFHARVDQSFRAPTPPAEDDEDSDAAHSEDAVPSRGRRMNGARPDLRRDVLKRSGKANGQNGSRAATPHGGAAPNGRSQIIERDSPEPEVWFHHPVDGNIYNHKTIEPNQSYKRHVYNMYANLPIYCFFRMFEILYLRLNNLKDQEQSVRETVKRMKASKAALDLRMADRGPESFFGDTGPDANYYQQMLVMMEDVIREDTDVDMLYLEDVLRRFYLSNGWMLFSIDKLLSALVRFGMGIHTTDGKDKSWDIVQLFMKDRRKDVTTHQDEFAYRRQSEKMVKEGDVYHIQWVSVSSCCCCIPQELTIPSRTRRLVLPPFESVPTLVLHIVAKKTVSLLPSCAGPIT